MIEFIQNHHQLLIWLSAASVVSLIISMIAIPWILIRLPSDYFVYKKRKTKKIFIRHLFVRSIFLVLKNILGFMLIVSGIMMLFIPGQGILTIIIGIILTDFPYKYRIERWIITRPRILSTLNQLRMKAKKQPFRTKENSAALQRENVKD